MLRMPGGEKFMRRIATQPHGYDRLDRLMRLPRGEQISISPPAVSTRPRRYWAA